MFVCVIEDIGETHFGGFMTKKKPSLHEAEEGEEVSNNGLIPS